MTGHQDSQNFTYCRQSMEGTYGLGEKYYLGYTQKFPKCSRTQAIAQTAGFAVWLYICVEL